MKLRSNVTNETNQQHDNLLSGYLPIYTALSLADESGHGLLFEGEDNRTRVRRNCQVGLRRGAGWWRRALATKPSDRSLARASQNSSYFGIPLREGCCTRTNPTFRPSRRTL